MKPRPSPRDGPKLSSHNGGVVDAIRASLYASAERYVVTTTVLDLAGGPAAAAGDTAGVPVTCRIGLLGLGNVGAAFARLVRDAAGPLTARGIAPLISAALVRSTTRVRPASPLAIPLTDTVDGFFAGPLDVVVEALGGVDPAYALVRRALDRGIPVVTANKSLIAAHGEELAQLAWRRGTALRYEAACIAGVPFLGTFERRPLASRASAVTAIVNGTSNFILSAMSSGAAFHEALADAQRLGLAEPDATMDVSGADAAAKLAILVRVFGRLLVSPASLPIQGIAGVEPSDLAAAAAFDGVIRPVAHASWLRQDVRAFVAPAFLERSHALAHVGGVTNGIEIIAERGSQCYIGPGAGPEVTAATLLDDVAEVMTERPVRCPAPDPAGAAVSIARPDSAWFLRFTGATRESDVADLLGSYGIWCRRLARRADRVFALTCAANHARVAVAVDAVQAATGSSAAAFPALVEDAGC